MDRLSKARDFCKKYGIVIGAIAAILIVGWHYVTLSTRNIVFMDYWRCINDLIPCIYGGKDLLAICWEGTFGQRNLILKLILAFNIKCLGLNCQWESYAGICVMALTTFVVYSYLQEKAELISSNKGINVRRQLFIIPLIITIYNLNQWEILSLEFSFAFTLRVLSNVLCWICIDRTITSSTQRISDYLLCGIFAGAIICLLSQLYWPCFIIVCLMAICFSFILNMDKLRCLACLTAFLIPVLISICIYFYNLPMGASGGNFSNFIKIVLSGDIFLALSIMVSAVFLPNTVVPTLSNVELFLIGSVVLVIIVFCVIGYFKKRLFRFTFLPLMFLFYGLISMPIIIYGRLSVFDLKYMASSRYTVETIWIWTGIVCMIYLYTADFNNIVHFLSKGILKGISVVLLIVIPFMAILYSDHIEFQIAPNRGIYKDNLIRELRKYELNDSALSGEIDELSALLQSTPDLVEAGIKLLREHDLNIYGFQFYEPIDSALQTEMAQ